MFTEPSDETNNVFLLEQHFSRSRTKFDETTEIEETTRSLIDAPSSAYKQLTDNKQLAYVVRIF
jgi:hypothetical protein